ncbi:MAG TPA: hypothetical protein VKA37_00670 [Halobacteriales archaeon]|nr:hypothetical protein [Halobacteriales archaeon]
MSRRLPSKLQAYATILGSGVAAVALWAVFVYGTTAGALATLAFVVAVGAAIVVSPIALAHGKRALERRRHAKTDQETYVSSPIDRDRGSFFEEARDVLAGNDAFVAVKERDFPEGTGLVVDHTSFHGTFVRLTGTGRIVVTGIKSGATVNVVDSLEAHWPTSFSPSASNPFVGPIPVRGAPRVFLVLLLAAVAVANVALVAGVAYPTPAYNPGEKTVLMAHDFRADVDPGVSETDADLAKADFLISVLREESNEIRWEAGLNGTQGVPEHDADAISADVTELLERVEASGPDADQRERLGRLEREHDEALTAVRTAVAEVRAGNSSVGGSERTATSLVGLVAPAPVAAVADAPTGRTGSRAPSRTGPRASSKAIYGSSVSRR